MSRLRVTDARVTLALLCGAHVALVLDLTIVNVALPAIADDLGCSPAAIHWAVSAYALAFGGALLAGGRIADRIGHRTALGVGIAGFALASLVCALAPTSEVLIAGRTIQGLAAALADPAALGLLAVAFPAGAERHRALAVWASTTAFAAAAGLFLGGALTQLLSWRAVFLVAVPVGVVLPALAPRLLPEAGARRRVAFDGRSAALGTAFLVLLAGALATLDSSSGAGTATAILASAAVALAVAFAHRERRVEHPLVPTYLVADRTNLVVLATGAAAGALVLSTYLLLPMALEHELGLAPAGVGLMLLLSRGPGVVWSRLVHRLLGAVGPYATAALGMGLLLVAQLLFTRIGGGGLATVLAGLLVFSLGVPCVFMASSTAVLAAAGPGETAAAASVLSTAQWLGGATGLALVTLAAAGGTHGAFATGTGFWVCVAISLAGLAAATTTLRQARLRAVHASA